MCFIVKSQVNTQPRLTANLELPPQLLTEAIHQRHPQ